VAIGLVMIGGGLAAGVFGSLLGLGGGILIVPLLTLGFDLPLRDAVGVSLVCVIVTSSASASVYLQRHVANLRLGMLLELFTAIGAIGGAVIAFVLSEQVLAGLFAILLVYVGLSMIRTTDPPSADAATGTDASAAASDRVRPLDMDPAAAASEPTAVGRLSGPGYVVRNIPLGLGGSVVAGVVSALLGVGGGLVKVPVMHLAMGVPLRVATATSNLMIGITASAGAIVYLMRDEIDPLVAGPTALGVFVGASVGSRAAHRVDIRVLRLLFVVVLGYTAIQMLRRAVGVA
jgi:uncharacterized membrane protein YfcA